MTTGTSFMARASREQRRRPVAAFTLLESVVVLVVVGILLGVVAASFDSVRRGQVDLAGKPLLGAAQVDARRVAATNGYTFPVDLATRLASRSAVVNESGETKLTYVPGQVASYAPGTAHNTGGGYQISTAAAGAMSAFAVETTADDRRGVGHCWTLVDRTTVYGATGADGSRRATTWGYSEDLPIGDCRAELVLDCPAATSGTADEPSDAATCPPPTTGPADPDE